MHRHALSDIEILSPVPHPGQVISVAGNYKPYDASRDAPDDTESTADHQKHGSDSPVYLCVYIDMCVCVCVCVCVCACVCSNYKLYDASREARDDTDSAADHLKYGPDALLHLCVYIHVYIYVFMYACVCLCVCVQSNYKLHDTSQDASD